jgi:arginase
MTGPDASYLSEQQSSRNGDVTLRLLWPQWQGTGTSSVRAIASEFPFDVAHRGYAVGSAVLEAVLPTHDGPTAAVPVAMNDAGRS